MNTLLLREKASIETQLKVIKDTWLEKVVPIIYDRWKDCKNRSLINVIAALPRKAMLLKAVDYEGQVKNASFIANILMESIEMGWAANVVQVITNNAKNCGAAKYNRGHI